MSASVAGCIAAEDCEFMELDSFITANKHAHSFSLSGQALHRPASCSKGRYYFYLPRQFINVLKTRIQKKKKRGVSYAFLVRHGGTQAIHRELTFHRQVALFILMGQSTSCGEMKHQICRC